MAKGQVGDRRTCGRALGKPSVERAERAELERYGRREAEVAEYCSGIVKCYGGEEILDIDHHQVGGIGMQPAVVEDVSAFRKPEHVRRELR